MVSALSLSPTSSCIVHTCNQARCARSIHSRVHDSQGTNDSTLPLAHACFFNLELPEYSAYETLRKRLLTAMNYSVGYYGIV